MNIYVAGTLQQHKRKTNDDYHFEILQFYSKDHSASNGVIISIQKRKGKHTNHMPTQS